jgi:hypothetical protein
MDLLPKLWRRFFYGNSSVEAIRLYSLLLLGVSGGWGGAIKLDLRRSWHRNLPYRHGLITVLARASQAY